MLAVFGHRKALAYPRYLVTFREAAPGGAENMQSLANAGTATTQVAGWR